MARGAAAVVLVFAAMSAMGQKESDLQSEVDKLVRWIGTADARGQEWGVGQLGWYGEPGLAALFGYVLGSDRRLSYTAMQQTVYVRSPRVLPILLKKLKGCERGERSTVLLAIANHGNPMAFEALTGYVKDDDWLVRHAAACALGKIGDPKGIAILEGLAGDTVHSVRWQAKESTKWIRSMNKKFPERLTSPQWWTVGADLCASTANCSRYTESCGRWRSRAIPSPLGEG